MPWSRARHVVAVTAGAGRRRTRPRQPRPRTPRHGSIRGVGSGQMLPPGVVVVTAGRLGRGSVVPAARACSCSPVPTSGATGDARGPGPDAVAAIGRPSIRWPSARRLRRPRAATASGVRRDGRPHCRGRHPEGGVLEYAPGKRGHRRTGSTCPPTSSTRSPVRRGEAPAVHRLGAWTGPSRPRPGRRAPCAGSPGS